MHDQKKLEKAFFKALRHLLPKKFTYTIVADRGFGHDRIVDILTRNNFNYVLRVRENLNVSIADKWFNLNELSHRNQYLPKVNIVKWHRKISLIKRVKGNKSWILMTNLPPEASNEVGDIYEKRFSIEKMFKNQKSGGFDIEKLQIKKYDRFKKFLFIACIAYTIMMFAGLLMHYGVNVIKKTLSQSKNFF